LPLAKGRYKAALVCRPIPYAEPVMATRKHPLDNQAGRHAPELDGQITSRFEATGPAIVARRACASLDQGGTFYAVHKARPFSAICASS